MTTQIYQRYSDLILAMANAAKDDDQLAYEEAKDQFRALPGFPQGIHPDLDRVVPQIVDASNTIITLGSTN
jgi:hypothetical protein